MKRCYELSRLRREFFDRINKIFLYSLYLPAGRQVLNILSILSKKWDFLYYERIAPSVRACRGSIYRTRNDGRHKCRPYKGLKRKFLYYLVIIPLVFLCSFTWAETKNNDIDFLYNFLKGSYELIGRFPDSNMTYTGKVILKKSGDYLEVIRTIKNKVIKGTGKIETATADKIKVLRIRFIDENKSYEATYLIDSDLDNYARLTGYLYLKEGGTKKPGLEALFIVPR